MKIKKIKISAYNELSTSGLIYDIKRSFKDIKDINIDEAINKLNRNELKVIAAYLETITIILKKG